MYTDFNCCRLTSVIGVVPENISYFDDEIKNYSHDVASSMKLKAVMGYGQHHVVKDGSTTAKLAESGFKKLLENKDVSLDEVDALFFVSQTPDYVLPPTSSVLHGLLGLKKDCYCIDINDGCNGYIKGLFEALSFLKATNGKCVVLIAGDVLSNLVSKRDRNSYPLVGDAATVTVIRRDERWVDDYIKIAIENNGLAFEKLIIPSGGALSPVKGDEFEEEDSEGNWRSSRHLKMNGRDVFAFTQTVVPEFLSRFVNKSGATFDSLDRAYFHQANSFIIDRLRKKFGLSEKVAPDRVVRTYGNSSSATIPMLIASEDEYSRKDKCLLAGFGVGLSWGACFLSLGKEISKGILKV